MDRIGNEVEQQLSRFEGAAAMQKLVSIWPDVVGDEIARNAWPARIARDRTLHVSTSSAVWAFELGQLAPQILERLGSELGPDAPAALRFTQGHLPEPPPPGLPPRSPEQLQPSADIRADAASLASPIADPELREQVAKAVALALARSLGKAADGRPF